MELHKCFPKFFSKILHILVLIVLLFFLPSAGFRDGRTSGWYQQFFPNLNGSTITSMTFLDSLTGFAVTNTNSSIQSYILKTTNGGDNWVINYTYNSGTNIRFTKIQFADNNIGYASTNFFDFFKTTNAGLNWMQLSNPDGAEDMVVINQDTVLVVTSDGFAGGVYRTTNGGYNWQTLGPVGGSGQPYRIYMYDKNMGFTMGSQMKKTTNGGVDWLAIPGESFTDIQFTDSLTGWKTNLGIKKTTDGGLNWLTQQLPNISSSYNNPGLCVLNKDTVWMVGARLFSRAPVYKTTNGGVNWGYQIPDTTIQRYSYQKVIFVDRLHGWIYPDNTDFILHTKSGGNDTTFFTGVNNIVATLPDDFILYQNYPNPFNPVTKISFDLPKDAKIKLIVYDILGREVTRLLNSEFLQAGKHIINFDAMKYNLASGVYFYRIESGDFNAVKKMILIK